MMTDNKIQKKSRKELIEALSIRDGYQCFYCQISFVRIEDITIDHFFPKAHGGTWELDNLRLACFKCNNTKGDTIPNEDGTITFIDKKNKQPKAQRPFICEHCLAGRKVEIGEKCIHCGSGPQPSKFPQARKRKPKNCPHNGIYWCWLCAIGLI